MYYNTYGFKMDNHQDFITDCSRRTTVNSIYHYFITDCLDHTTDNNDSITLTDLHDLMKRWYTGNLNGKYPNRCDFKNHIKTRTDSYNNTNNTLVGYKFKLSDSELDDLE